MTFQPSSIIAALTEITVDGWDIRGLSNIPEQVDTRAGSVLFPDMTNLITELSITDASYGEAVAMKDANYTLTYIYACKRVEAGRSITEYALLMVEAVEDLVEAIATTSFSDAGGIQVTPAGITAGIVSDPTGNQFFGGFLRLNVLEFVV